MPDVVIPMGDRGAAVATSTSSPSNKHVYPERYGTYASVGANAGRRGIAAFTVATPDDSRLPEGLQTKPPRWRTPEFLFYGLVFVVMVPVMVKVPIDLSQSSHRNYLAFSYELDDGWIPGRKVDNSDIQYRSFRDHFPVLLLLFALYLLASKLYALLVGRRALSARGQLFGWHRQIFLLGFSTLFLVGLHGTSAFKILAILAINFVLSRLTGGVRIVGPALTWAFNIGILFANELYSGYKYANMWPGLGKLDDYEGLMPRWHIMFNFTILRLISFNMDYHWARQAQQGQTYRPLSNGHTQTAPSEPSNAYAEERARVVTPHPLQEYSIRNYLSYVLYPPLYIAGPILSFNNFLSQLHRPLCIPFRTTVLYALRFAGCMLTMEFTLHFMYVVAIKNTHAWADDTPFELSMIGFWNLIVVWLKLLLPWRFFRLWAMADGVDAPENMIRCMANNYSTLGFWRSWHRSYNLWVVRYLYIPVGGSSKLYLSVPLVFTFVALWHDLELKLLTWGWLVSLFIAPELICRALIPASKYGERKWYRHVCALGGVGNVLMMMTANLVGFVIGIDGMRYMLGQLVGSWEGLRFLLAACAVLFVGVQVMFEYREEEARRGIFRKC